MQRLSIDYRKLSYEALTKIIELANLLETTPEKAARTYLEHRTKSQRAQRRAS